jgi:uncharacterized membrane protein required for colicin V production
LRGSGSDGPCGTVTQGGSVDLGEFLGGVKTVDLLLVLYFMAFFVLGFAQGTIRRLIGLASILFSFLFAANVAAPLGDFLSANWTDQSPQYSYMVGFMTVFVAAALAFAIVVQGFYKPQPLFERARFADEILGGLLGLLQAAIILAAIVIILDTYYTLTGVTQGPNELQFLRDLFTLLNDSRIVAVFRTTLIPAFFVVVGLFIPNSIKVLYPSSPS